MMLTSKEPIFRDQAEAFERWAEQGAQPNPKMVEKVGVHWQIPVNKQNSKGETILMHACYHGNQLTVEYLLKQGADPRIADKRGMTALHSCVMNQVIYIPIILMLLDPTKTQYPADVDAKSPSGHTPLQMAAAIGNLNLVKALIGKQANLMAGQGSDDGTPKDIARKHGNMQIVGYIQDVESQFPKQLVKKPRSQQGGKVRRRWSFSQRAAQAGGNADQKALMKGLDELKDTQEPPKQPEPPKEDAEVAAAKKEALDNMDDEDREKFVFKDGFHLQYDSKKGKLMLADKASVKSAFDQMDWKKRDGKLTVHEFETYFGRQGLKRSRCRRLFRLFDKNGDTKISFKEFNARIQELLESEIPRSPHAGSPRAARQKSGHGW